MDPGSRADVGRLAPGPRHHLWVTLGGEVAVTGEPAGLVWAEAAEGGPSAAPTGTGEAEWLFLGESARGHLWALLLPAVPSDTQADADVASDDEIEALPLPTGARWANLKDVLGELGEEDSEAALTAVALARWHQRHSFSPVTGEATEVTSSGWVRRGPGGDLHFPRTDAAVIMAVTDDADRLLLARGRGWAPGRLSVLAGFVEPGESLEQAVAREVDEEVGVAVTDVRYVGSQPWPFPSSLMVGFTASAGHQPGTHVPASSLEHDEIVEARWFTRAELAEAVSAGEVQPPGLISIARRLIEDWFGGPLPQHAELRGSIRD